ncbi:MAG: UpxY family transcription antiterminator [Nitrospirae bacterium]|nr:UpxY family transcription antiterminator [Nitrospirota bacterium]
MSSIINESMTEDLFWFAVHVKSRHEFKVQERLAKSGIEVFLPVVEKLSKWKDRKKLIEFPMFNGYLFVHIPKSHGVLLSVLKTPGVARFIGMTPGEPESVPDEQIESLKKIVENKETIDPYPYLKEGNRVRIKRGALAGVEGILVQKAGQHLLVLSIDLLQQGVSLKIDSSEVEPI